jgi:transcriptional regulator with XRE-family HTH domain
MKPPEIRSLRESFELSQIQFAQLMGVHPITVSKWERGVSPPTPYQMALLDQFRIAARLKGNRDQLKGILIGMGITMALALLLKHLMKK